MRLRSQERLILWVLAVLGILGLSKKLLASEPSWDANLPKLERETTPFFSFTPGISITTLNSFGVNQTNRVLFGGFSWENESLVASTSIISYLEHRDIYDIRTIASRFTQYGPGEILWKPIHLGLRFEGLTMGYDLRLGISDYYRWGVLAVVNLFRKETVRLDFRTGYLGEKMQLNLNPIERTGFPQALVLSWATNRFSGQVKTEFRFYTPWDQNSWEFELGVYMRVRLFSIDPVQCSLRLDLSYQHQSFLEAYKSVPDWFLGTLGIEIRI